MKAKAWCMTLDKNTAEIEIMPIITCADCRNRQESNVAGFFYCDAWGKDLNASVYDPNKYFCAEGEKR